MKKILVVDDEIAIQDIFNRKLVNSGHQIIYASSADEAIRALRNERFDIMFLDYNLDIHDRSITSEPVVEYIKTSCSVVEWIVFMSNNREKAEKLKNILGFGEVCIKLDLVCANTIVEVVNG